MRRKIKINMKRAISIALCMAMMTTFTVRKSIGAEEITTEEITEYTIFFNENTSNLYSDKTEKMTVTTTQNQNKETEIKTKEEEIEYYNTILENVENLFTNGSFNTSNLENIEYMFKGCSSLIELNLILKQTNSRI